MSKKTEEYSTEQVGKAFGVAQFSKEALEYLEKIVGSERLGEGAEYAKFQHLSTKQPWFGEIPASSNFLLMQENSGTANAQAYKAQHNEGTLEFYFATGPNREVIRAYSVNGKLLTDMESVGYLDRVLQACLAANALALRDGKANSINQQGTELPKQEATGEQIGAVFKRFGEFLTKKGIAASVTQLAYQEPAKVEKITKSVQPSVEQVKQEETQTQTPKASQ